ncbi:MAG: hypothetical protein MI922_00550, partial [Bacteroidales bacterium]|nr:hypothetical protein [Bacteroidales bacterium]
GETDDEGKVRFDNVLQGVYYITGENIEVAGVKYKLYKPIMVSAGKISDVVIKPTDYSGAAELKVVATGWGYDSLAINAKVALIDYSDAYSGNSFIELHSAILMEEEVDQNGMVNFENIPIGSYKILVYYSNERYELVDITMNISKKEEYKNTVLVSYSKLFGFN